MFDIARMFNVEGGPEAVGRWPTSKWMKYRAYWVQYTRRDLFKRGIDPDPPKPDPDDDKSSWRVEEDESSPFRGARFTDEIAHAPRD